MVEVETEPQFYVFAGLDSATTAIGNHAKTSSWMTRGVWSATDPSDADVALMTPHLGKWERIIGQLGLVDQ